MQSNKTTASLLQPDLFPDFRTASFSPPKHSRDLCIPQRKWEFLCKGGETMRVKVRSV